MPITIWPTHFGNKEQIEEAVREYEAALEK